MKKTNLILAIIGAIFSGLCALNAIYSGTTAPEFIAASFLVGFLTYLQFQWFDVLFYGIGDTKRAFAGIGAVFLFCIQVSGNTFFWLSSQSTEAARLVVLEHNLKIAENDKITALALLNNCNDVVVKGCIKPRSEELKVKELAFNTALSTYNTQIKAITHTDSFKIASSFFGGIDHKQFFFLRALIGSFFFEIGIIYCWLSSRSKPLDKLDTVENESLKKTVESIRNLSDLTEIQSQVLAAYELYDTKDQILRNGLPSPMSQFTVAAFGAGKQGSTHKNNAINALYQLGFITEETYKKQQSSEA